MKDIHSYFKTLQKKNTAYTNQKDFLERIFFEYGISLSQKKVEIKYNILHISFSPSERLIVSLKKQEILQKINKEQKVTIIDIR